MDSGTILSVIGVVISGSALTVSVLALMRLRKLDRIGKFKELGEAIDDVHEARLASERSMSDRISKIEGALAHIPTGEQMGALRHELTKAEAAIAGVDARLVGFEDTLKSHENRISQIFEDALAKGRNAGVKL